MKRGTRIQYRILYRSCRFLGRLGERFLYGPFAGLLYFLLYRVAGYRLKVVRGNLSRAFPEKSPQERLEIERRFYRHLAEVFVDTIRLVTLSREEILARMIYTNQPEHEERMRGRSWISAMSHFGSWELTINYVCNSDHRVLAVYHPLHSKAFDFYYRWARSRFGTQPIPMRDIYREVIGSRQPLRQNVTVALLADQRPPLHEATQWLRFLNQETAFVPGPGRMAKRFGMPVVFMYVRQVRPRHYEAQMQEIYDGREDISEQEITRRYAERLEAQIREAPHLWMWSHHRWRYTPESVARWVENETLRGRAAAEEQAKNE